LMLDREEFLPQPPFPFLPRTLLHFFILHSTTKDTKMPLTAYHLLCLFAILAVTQAQLKPSSILCARSHNRSPFMAEHCRKWVPFSSLPGCSSCPTH
jgi:hypothetical protein